MPHVNTGRILRRGTLKPLPSNTGLPENRRVYETDQNCALCTAAAVVNYGLELKQVRGRFYDTSQVATEMGQPNQLEDAAIHYYRTYLNARPDVPARRGLEGQIVRPAGPAPQPGDSNVDMLECQASGLLLYCRRKLNYCSATQYGDPADAPLLRTVIEWMHQQPQQVVFALWFTVKVLQPHWTFARNFGQLEFIDYQTDSELYSAPTVTDDLPVIGIKHEGTPNPDRDTGIAIAFWPTQSGNFSSEV